MNYDPKFRVCPDTKLFYAEILGERRYFGCLPPRPIHGCMRASERFGAPIPRSSWRDFSLMQWTGPTRDQNGFGACTGFGATAAFQGCWNFTAASKHDFSSAYAYSLVNGGRDQGAVVADLAKTFTSKGVCLIETVNDHTIYRRNYDANKADAEASRFRAAQTLAVESFDEIVSEILRGRCVSFGIEIGSNFKPSADGIVPPRRGGGGGHCMCAAGVRMIENAWRLEVKNSWSAGWGVGGNCWLDDSYFRGYVDAFVFVRHIEDPQEPNQPPVAA